MFNVYSFSSVQTAIRLTRSLNKSVLGQYQYKCDGNSTWTNVNISNTRPFGTTDDLKVIYLKRADKLRFSLDGDPLWTTIDALTKASVGPIRGYQRSGAPGLFSLTLRAPADLKYRSSAPNTPIAPRSICIFHPAPRSKNPRRSILFRSNKQQFIAISSI